MLLSELLPSVHALPRADKLRLIQVLAADVASEDALDAPAPERPYPVWSPYGAVQGAATLLRVLAEEAAS
jgi:hypothetical protein